MRVEHKVIDLDSKEYVKDRLAFRADPEAWLNEFGAKGWRLTYLSYPRVIFTKTVKD